MILASAAPITGSGTASSAGKPKVLYIMGAGRSGSTVLGVALGNCTDHFFVGELEKWFSRSGVSPRKGEQRAGFWARVLEHVDDPTDLFGREHTALERSSALLDPRAWFIRRRLRERYRRVAEELYVAIRDVAAASYIVDTSHYPLRARELQALDGIELYLVYLVRDPQGVVASLDVADPTSFSMNTLVANAYLWLTHLVSVFVFLRHPSQRRMFLRHEDFLDDPASVLRQILDRTGSSAPVPDLTALATGLAFQGNRFLRAETIALRAPRSAGARSSLSTKLLQLPWAPVFARLRPRVSPKSRSPSPTSG